MNLLQLITKSFLHHRRMNVAVALGVAVATAVLTGALLVGDSMQSSLRRLVVDRLGRIDHVLVGQGFFGADLPARIENSPGFHDHFSEVQGAILLSGTLEHASSGRRAPSINVLGVDPRFWTLDARAIPSPPGSFIALGDDEIELGELAAQELDIKPSDVPDTSYEMGWRRRLTTQSSRTALGPEVILRLAKPNAVAAESTLGRKKAEETIVSRRFRVVRIVPAQGLGGFDLRASQLPARNAFVSVGALQSLLKQPKKNNAMLVASDRVDHAAGPDATIALQKSLRPRLADYGLTLQRRQQRFGDEVLLDYFDLTSDRMLLPPAVEAAALKAFEPYSIQPALTYLANWIKPPDRPVGAAPQLAWIPYSTVTAVDPFMSDLLGGQEPDALGPYLLDGDGKFIWTLAADEIVVTSWVRDSFKAHGYEIRPGDPIKITYFDPERDLEHTATFKLRAIVPLAERGQKPTPSNVPELTPTVAGITDRTSIRNWDPPFRYDSSRIRTEDEKYWDDHKTTPKAYISLAAGQKLWGSRFGRITSIRIPTYNDAFAKPVTEQQLTERLEAALDPESLGFVFRPVKRQGLEASAGTTPFSVLFLGFSMFLIAAAVMLVALLFSLGVQGRAAELGILLASGFTRRRLALVMAGEVLLVAAVGGLLGVAGGIGFGALMVHGLTTWWVDAISTPFVQFDYSWPSLAIGFACGTLVPAVVTLWTARRMRRRSVRSLLSKSSDAADPAGAAGSAKRRGWIARAAAGVLVVAAIGLGALALGQSGETQALAFFGSGALVLVAVLVVVWERLRAGGAGSLVTTGSAAIARLAARNAARHPSRSTLTIGLVAAATFLIVAISAFRLDPSSAGTGGFALFAQSDQPIYQSLDRQREELGFSEDEQRLLADTKVVSLRVHGGDDASCLNVYRPGQPRLLGVPIAGPESIVESILDRGGAFQWAGSLAESDADRAAPWRLLAHDGEGPTPVIIDANTATYSLKVGLGDVLTIENGQGDPVELKVVGLLKNSVLQGDVLMDERQFVRHFPDSGGRRVFLIDTPAEKKDEVAQTLQRVLGDYGFDAQASLDRLRAFQAVQNTYLSTFQSLGALGLLLGTFGLATVELRNVVERRGELALMRAAGFRLASLARMVLWENTVLLAGGLAVGLVAALVALLPHLAGGGAQIPWLTLAAMLAAIAVAGILASGAAVVSVLRAPLVPALRGE